MKQQTLKEHRDYLANPRRNGEFDKDYRGDIDFTGEISLTRQSEAESADINVIMKRYEQTGILPEMMKQNPEYGDFSDMGTYQEALNIVAFANSQFMALDAHVRARFSNDPAQFLDFCSNPENGPELVKMGLAVERQAPEATPTPAKTSPKAKSTASTDKAED